MSKTWQTRLAQTIMQVRNTEGDLAADTLQAIVNRLPQNIQEQVSNDLSLGYRLVWNRTQAKTNERAVERANRLSAIALGKVGTLGLAVFRAVQQIPYVNSIKELELRLLDPVGFYMGFIGGDAENSTTQAQYQWALTHRWANSCGGFSAALKQIISGAWDTLLDTNTDVAVRSRAYVANQFEAALNDITNKYLRVNLGCHSFMIENIGSDCRVYQVYMAVGFGGYNFADDMENQVVQPRATFIRNIRSVVEDEAAANARGGVAFQLFKGTCYPSLNTLNNQHVCARIERTTAPRSVADMADAAEAMTDAMDAAWQAALAPQTVQAYNALH